MKNNLGKRETESLPYDRRKEEHGNRRRSRHPWPRPGSETEAKKVPEAQKKKERAERLENMVLRDKEWCYTVILLRQRWVRVKLLWFIGSGFEVSRTI